MKNIIFIFTFFFSAYSFSQSYTYKFFPRDSGEWISSSAYQGDWTYPYTQNIDGFTIEQTHFLIKGDTIVENKLYSKIFSYRVNYFLPYIYWPPRPRGDTLDYQKMTDENFSFFLREDCNKKVYIKYIDSPEKILYDFDLEVGDTVTVDFNITCNVCPRQNKGIVRQVDTIKSIFNPLNGRKQFKIIPLGMDSYDIYDNFWIEGFGSYYGLLTYSYVTGIMEEMVRPSSFKGNPGNSPYPVYGTQSPTICNSQSITVGSNTYTARGTYTDTLMAANGCDSIVTTNLVVNSTYSETLNVTINNGDSIQVGSSIYKVAGTYIDTLIASNGCDSIVTTNLTVITGISEKGQVTKDEWKVEVYPNPFSKIAYLRIANFYEYTNDGLELRIYDVLGREVLKSPIPNLQTKIQRDNLLNGIYFYQVKNKNEIVATGKLAVQ